MMPFPEQGVLALDVLTRIVGGACSAQKALKSAFRANQARMCNSARAAVSRWVLGVCCLRGRMDALLLLALDHGSADGGDGAKAASAAASGDRPGWRELLASSSSSPAALRCRLAGWVAMYQLEVDGGAAGATAAQLEHCWLAMGLAAPDRAALGGTHVGGLRARLRAQCRRGGVRGLGAAHSLPGWLATMWAARFGLRGAAALAAASNKPAGATLRTRVCGGCGGGGGGGCSCEGERAAGDEGGSCRAALAGAVLAGDGWRTERTRLSPWGLAVRAPAKPNVWGSSAWRAGRFEVMDEGSQLVALACTAPPPSPGAPRALWTAAAAERGGGGDGGGDGTPCRDGPTVVVDFCAGRGGKLLALAMLGTAATNSVGVATVADGCGAGGSSAPATGADSDAAAVATSTVGANAREVHRAVARALQTGSGGDTVLLVAHDISAKALSDLKTRWARAGTACGAARLLLVQGQDCAEQGKLEAGGGNGGSVPGLARRVPIGGATRAAGQAVAEEASQAPVAPPATCAAAAAAPAAAAAAAAAAEAAAAGEEGGGEGGAGVATKPGASARTSDFDAVSPFRVADVVLVDAPCSSLGTLRRGPNVRWEIDEMAEREAWFGGFAPLQLSILCEAAALVARGGVLVYATCTLRREENEGVARAFETAAQGAGFARVPLAEAWGTAVAGRVAAAESAWRERAQEEQEKQEEEEEEEEDSGGTFALDAADAPAATRHCATLTPHAHGTDGFFVARWRRV